MGRHRHGPKGANKGTKRDSLELFAKNGQAELLKLDPRLRVKVGLVRVNGAESRGFVVSVPDAMWQAKIDAGLDNLFDHNFMLARSWLAGKPRRFEVPDVK